jgi:hypothetical protein
MFVAVEILLMKQEFMVLAVLKVKEDSKGIAILTLLSKEP